MKHAQVQASLQFLQERFGYSVMHDSRRKSGNGEIRTIIAQKPGGSCTHPAKHRTKRVGICAANHLVRGRNDDYQTVALAGRLE